jgi:hypothetical protein
MLSAVLNSRPPAGRHGEAIVLFFILSLFKYKQDEKKHHTKNPKANAVVMLHDGNRTGNRTAKFCR